jgi:hypothetical protein
MKKVRPVGLHLKGYASDYLERVGVLVSYLKINI